ncbi:MAG: hypothetical protein AMS20_07595 [Gemmatimonas sp. SG8_28]|nr:MAG: hypothetical protein AMS20_07595 [Gemmatimonas sp. SG8_28]
MTTYRRTADVEAAPMQGETVLFNPGTSQFCVLNETAAFLWGLLEEPQTEEQLRERLCRAFDGVEPAAAEKDVREVLEQFAALGVAVPV